MKVVSGIRVKDSEPGEPDQPVAAGKRRGDALNKARSVASTPAKDAPKPVTSKDVKGE